MYMCDVFAFVYLYVNVCPCVITFMCMYVYMYVCACVYVYSTVYMYTYICVSGWGYVCDTCDATPTRSLYVAMEAPVMWSWSIYPNRQEGICWTSDR